MGEGACVVLVKPVGDIESIEYLVGVGKVNDNGVVAVVVLLVSEIVGEDGRKAFGI